MQIKKTGFFSLKGPLSRNNKLKFLKIGDKISVQIVNKISDKEALLNLKGNLIKANFNQKIPDFETIQLVLEGIESDKLVFSLENELHLENILIEIEKLTLFSLKDYTGYQLKLLNKIFHRGIKNIFSLNMFLYELKFNRKTKQIDYMENIFLHLIDKGVSEQNLLFFSLFFSNIPEAHYQLLHLLFAVLGKKNKFLDEKTCLKILDDLENKNELNELLNNFNNNEISEIFNYIFREENTKFGSLIFFDEEKERYENIKYIMRNDYILYSFELTFLGKIEVIIQTLEKKKLNITIFAENDSKTNILKKDKMILHDKLNKLYGNFIDINIINMENVYKKIVAINKSLQLNSALDIRV